MVFWIKRRRSDKCWKRYAVGWLARKDCARLLCVKSWRFEFFFGRFGVVFWFGFSRSVVRGDSPVFAGQTRPAKNKVDIIKTRQVSNNWL